MKKAFSFILVLGITFGFVGAAAPSVHACSCMMPGSPQESLAATDAVFVGTVTEVKPKDEDLHRLVSFSVDRAWKGISLRTATIGTARDSAACGIDFQIGKTYVVYAYEREEEGLWAGLCSRTHEITAGNIESDEDVMALGTTTLALSSDSGSDSGIMDGVVTLIVGLLAVIAGVAAARFAKSKQSA